ncbi:MAG: hypothetical protein ACLP50_31555 [Solirubrobacteraceae bacterium]
MLAVAVAVVASYVAFVLVERDAKHPLRRHEAAQTRRAQPAAVEPSSQNGNRVVLNGWDLPRAITN